MSLVEWALTLKYQFSSLVITHSFRQGNCGNRKLNKNKILKNGSKRDFYIMQFPTLPIEVKERNYESSNDPWFTRWREILL